MPVLIFLVFLVELAGCASGSGETASRGARASDGNRLFDSGDEVFGGDPTFGSSEEASTKRQQAPTPSLDEWSIAVVTVSGPDHRAIAESARKEIVDRFEGLDGLYVEKVKGGSGVFYGRFRSPSSPEFRASMDLLKAIAFEDGRPAFPRLLPARPDFEETGELSPFDVRTLREQLGTKHPVYTLQIAQWGTFGDDELDYRAYRDRAEQFTRLLRTKGFNSWFSHNGGKRLSSVNVGVFGADAYDSRSTLYAPEVELLMGQFPELLVNGEPLMDSRTGKPIKPFLVEVPR